MKIFTSNPALLFVLSFLSVILLGSAMLMLPWATNGGSNYLDALFISTSAVCVTGLATVDTSSFYTQFGQVVILCLIQIGGLGILTFISYFSYFFKRNASYKSQEMMGAMNNVENLGDVFKTLRNILIVTFSIESVGAILIFCSISENLIPNVFDRIGFSIFHAVSGFCNAGFSLMKNSLYEEPYRHNYFFQLSVAAMIILGGLGFPIIVNIRRFFYCKISNFIRRIFNQQGIRFKKPIMSLDSYLSIVMTTILLLTGTIFFLAFEYNGALAEHSLFGKIVIAFCSSVTTRTAGFNSVDFGALSMPVTLVVIFLMWIGASPASTGGGIKTNTFAVACMNILSIVKGKRHVEVFHREIPHHTITLAFVVVMLSVFVISLSVFGLMMSDTDKGLVNIVFETVSAYGTVGLSRGITSSLSDPGKLIIIATMFIGRMSALTFLMAFVRRGKVKEYRYPKENILIN
jgi:potassium uptake TrkH family protein